MIKTTLYNLTRQDAKTLCKAFNNDVAIIGITLWNNGKAKTIDAGIAKARKLVKFIKNN